MGFTAPPGWPTPPPGWRPPPDWRPDPTWPPAPDGWRFWTDDAPVPRRPASATGGGRARPAGLAAALVAGGAVVLLLLGAGTTGLVTGWWSEQPDPVPTPTPTPSVPTPAPTPAPSPTPSPTPSTRTVTAPPPPTPEPDPTPEKLLLATQFGLGPATVGTSVQDVELAFGLDLEEQWADGECVVRLDDTAGIGTVDNGGAVQTYVVLTPQVRTVEGIGVGSTYDEVAAAYPQWLAGMSGWSTQYDGRFVPIEISPYAQTPDYTGTGRHMMFELDANDVVQRYRVGAPPYVFHVDVCTTPD